MNFKDTNARSFVKAVSWRIVGTLDTIFLSFLITGNSVIAVSIGITEILTKTLFYYLHERMWNRVAWGRGTTTPSHFRSLAKSISWRTVGTVDTMMLAWYFSRSMITGLSIGASELVTKVGLFYLHERLWSRIKWGRKMVSATESKN